MSTREKIEATTFCSNVTALRKRNQLSKKKMAKILGIGIKTLTEIEKGVLPPKTSCTALIGACGFFGISADDLLGKELYRKK